MRLSTRHAAASMVAMLVLIGNSVGQTEKSPNDPAAGGKKSVSPLVGTWHGLSLSISPEYGGRKTRTDADSAVSLIISDKRFLLRWGNTVLFDVPYVVDPNQEPGAIDLKSKGRDTLGI